MATVWWNLAVRSIALSWVVAWAGQASAAVVIANQTKATVAFELIVGGQTQRHALRPGELIPVPGKKPVQVSYVSGSDALTDEIEPDSLYYFIHVGSGAQLHRVSFETGELPRRRPMVGRARRPRKRAKPGDVIRVRLVVDRFHPEKNLAATNLLKLRVHAASEIVARYCGVRFEVVEVGNWPGDDKGLEYNDRQALLERELAKSKADLLLGFETPYDVDAKGKAKDDPKKPRRVMRQDRYLQPQAPPFASAILIPGHDTRVPEKFRLQQIVVALAGYLGAVPSPDSGSVMKQLSTSAARSNKGPKSMAFDPPNALAIALAGEQIQQKGARSFSNFEPRTAATMSAIRGAAEIKFRPDQLRQNGKNKPGLPRVVTRQGSRKIPVYDGAFADGTVVRSATLDGWVAKPGRPQTIENARLMGARLLDTERPLVWMRRTDARPQPPAEGFIEMHCGDRLPGRGVVFRAKKNAVPAHLVVSAERNLSHGREVRRREKKGEVVSTDVRIRTRWIRRIVRDRPLLAGYVPNTLIKTGGRRIKFRSVQLLGKTVRVLVDGQVESVPLDEVAELHFPEVDQWEAYYEQLAVLEPECRRTLLQCDTTWGLRATTLAVGVSKAVDYGQHNGGKRFIESYLPAWSLDALWVADDTIATRRFFKPYEVPLSLIRPAAERRTATLATGLPWQADRNVQGGPLSSGSLEFAWGFGVQATSELEFRLPACATGFRSWAGLDESVRGGGCVRARIHADSTKRSPRFESPLLVGSSHLIDTGAVRLSNDSRPVWRLYLVVDAAHEGRPEGADPWDVRDRFNWLEPRLILEQSKLKEEVDRRRATRGK